MAIVKPVFKGHMAIMKPVFKGHMAIVKPVFKGHMAIVKPVFKGHMSIVKPVFKGHMAIVRPVFKGHMSMVTAIYTSISASPWLTPSTSVKFVDPTSPSTSPSSLVLLAQYTPRLGSHCYAHLFHGFASPVYHPCTKGLWVNSCT